MVPTYELTGESFTIAGRGIVYTAILTCDTDRKGLDALIGTPLHGGVVSGVESFAVYNHPKGRPIGLLVKHDKI